MHQHYEHSVGFDSVFKDSLGDVMAGGRWQELVAGIGADVAQSVRGTLDSVAELAKSHRITAREARFLQAPLGRLYQVGVAAQRLSRMVDHPRITELESVSLDKLVADAVLHHQKQSRVHRIGVELTPLKVMALPEALASAIDSLFQWGMKLGRVLSVRLVKAEGMDSGELWLRVDQLDSEALEERNLDSVDWHVLWQVARLKGVKVKRKVENDKIRVQVKFQRLMEQQKSGFAILEQGYGEGVGNIDLANTIVWSIFSRSSVSALVLSTLGPHVPRLKSLANLQDLLNQPAFPDCIVCDVAVLDTDDFRRWRRHAQKQLGRSIAVIEITPQRNVFAASGLGPHAVARVSKDCVSSRLFSAMTFELSQITADADLVG